MFIEKDLVHVSFRPGFSPVNYVIEKAAEPF
jgi:hypothetical protein